MPNWREEENVFSIDSEFEEEPEGRESSSLLNTPRLSQRTIQRTTSPLTSPRRADRKQTHSSHQPLLESLKAPHSPSTTIEMQSEDDKMRYAAASGQTAPQQSFWDRLLCRPVPSSARTFNIGGGEDLRKHFCPNIIRNQKYHPSTFVFVVLYNQVRKCIMKRFLKIS